VLGNREEKTPSNIAQQQYETIAVVGGDTYTDETVSQFPQN